MSVSEVAWSGNRFRSPDLEVPLAQQMSIEKTHSHETDGQRDASRAPFSGLPEAFPSIVNRMFE